MDYEAVVGLEIHLQLNCPTKMFCDCANRPGDEPNRNTCPICLWMPGAIPRFSRDALERATIVCLALNCDIQPVSAFDQKVYYYPDLPKGFQLSQHHRPLARGGWLEIADEAGRPRKISLHHVHMEEDVARLVHEVEGRTPVSLVDFNRAGAPLVEIVTEPDVRSPHDAMAFLRALVTQVRYTGCSECSMEKGTMRADANVSLRLPGSDVLNTKVEIKNMNSIRCVGDAIAYEIERQAASLGRGEPIVLHTRLWDAERGTTVAMRAKFAGPCVPDPSVPPVVVTEEWVGQMRARLPEMPNQKVARFVAQYGLAREEAVPVSAERELGEYFEAVVREDVPPRAAVHWITTQLLPALKERRQTISETPVTPERLAGLLVLLESGAINANSAKEVLRMLFESDEAPEEIVERRGFRQISDAATLEAIVDQVLAANRPAVEDFGNGVTKSLGFLVGQAMKASQGKADPQRVREILVARLG